MWRPRFHTATLYTHILPPCLLPTCVSDMNMSQAISLPLPPTTTTVCAFSPSPHCLPLPLPKRVQWWPFRFTGGDFYFVVFGSALWSGTDRWVVGGIYATYYIHEIWLSFDIKRFGSIIMTFFRLPTPGIYSVILQLCWHAFLLLPSLLAPHTPHQEHLLCPTVPFSSVFGQKVKAEKAGGVTPFSLGWFVLLFCMPPPHAVCPAHTHTHHCYTPLPYPTLPTTLPFPLPPSTFPPPLPPFPLPGWFLLVLVLAFGCWFGARGWWCRFGHGMRVLVAWWWWRERTWQHWYVYVLCCCSSFVRFLYNL